MAVYLIPAHVTPHTLHVWVMGWQGPGELPVVVRLAGSPVAVASQYQNLPVSGGLRQPIGLLSLRELETGRSYELTFPGVMTQPGELHLATLPEVVPADGLMFLVASCYYRGLDDGRLARAVLNLPAHLQPAFKLLVGDQLYTDVPGFGLNNGGGAEKDYVQRYVDYWASPEYQPFLTHSPNFFTCDDHEFWNNYPEWQPHIRRTYPDVRAQYQRAALRLYDLFQGVANPGQSRWYAFTIEPVSFFMADTRSEREPFRPGARLISPRQEAALRDWAHHLVGPGILALGQPLLGLPGVIGRIGLWRITQATTRCRGSSSKVHRIRSSFSAAIFTSVGTPSSPSGPGWPNGHGSPSLSPRRPLWCRCRFSARTVLP